MMQIPTLAAPHRRPWKRILARAAGIAGRLAVLLLLIALIQLVLVAAWAAHLGWLAGLLVIVDGLIVLGVAISFLGLSLKAGGALADLEQRHEEMDRIDRLGR